MTTRWYVRRCAIGMLAAIGVYLLALALCAYLTVRGVAGEGEMETCVWLCALVASCAGALLCAGKTVKRGTMALCCGAAFFLATVLLGLLVGGATELSAALRLLAPVALGAVGALALLGKKGGGRKRAKRPRRARR